MKLGIAGTGKIVEDALYAIRPLEEIAVNAIFARPHSKAKGDALAEQYQPESVHRNGDPRRIAPRLPGNTGDRWS